MIYNKPFLTVTQQIEKLKSRGLIIKDSAFAAHYLKIIGYYRLAGYWWPMQDNKILHSFKPNSTFENIISIYNFDRELRILLFDVIERIEIAFRTKIIYCLSHEVSPWWFENQNCFRNYDDFTNNLIAIDRDLKNSKEVFIKEHYLKYHTDNRRPPSWKTIEVVSFGTISRLYGNLKHTVKSKDIIAKDFGTVNHTYLPSWLQAIAQIRNLCAHHSRLWNKNLPGRPRLLSKPPYTWIKTIPPVSEHDRLYIHLCCMKYLLNVVHPGNKFTEKLLELLERYPNIDKKALGIIDNWNQELLWVE